VSYIPADTSRTGGGEATTADKTKNSMSKYQKLRKYSKNGPKRQL